MARKSPAQPSKPAAKKRAPVRKPKCTAEHDSKVLASTGNARKPPNAGKGRKKGVPNKSTKAAKEALALAFEGLGGVPALTAWAAENQGEFYKLWVRLLPTEIKASGELGLGVVLNVSYGPPPDA